MTARSSSGIVRALRHRHNPTCLLSFAALSTLGRTQAVMSTREHISSRSKSQKQLKTASITRAGMKISQQQMTSYKSSDLIIHVLQQVLSMSPSYQHDYSPPACLSDLRLTQRVARRFIYAFVSKSRSPLSTRYWTTVCDLLIIDRAGGRRCA